MKKKHLNRKKKYKISNFSIGQFIVMLVVLGVLTALPAFLFGANLELLFQMRSYIFWYILYWAIVTFIIVAVIAYIKNKAFDIPMKRLSEGAEKVAKGDFSIYLEPIHAPDKKDYIDVMFEDFNKMVEELGSIETLKNDFIANVSHELKTPLSVIRGYASALKKEDISTEDQINYTDTIISAADNLTMLVTNILKLSRLENQEILTETEPYDLCEQLSEIAIAFEKSLEERNLEFEIEIENKLMLNIDSGMLELIWYNLLSNAVKFTQAGGKITLKQWSDENSVSVSVSDNGCGMDAETINHIFDKFYQGDSSHSGAGNGLGLALVKRITELASGIVSVKSSVGTGTTFTVRLNRN